jgi:uncharacterized protein (TIGR02118 family)
MAGVNGGATMLRISVLYPNEPGKKFDFDYYVNKHMALAERLLGPAGLVRAEVDRAADPNSPFMAAGHLYFRSMEDFQNGFFPHAAEFGADLVNYTDTVPQMQISEVIK